ncbi:hypothetical protein [Streptococcus sp. zg-JUN1979]|uniref:hypothetical protein n=1 Tax=Streptococcus sp. zg-JUN1979 TaxID=3391450 RepID=UPI0039A6607C
MKKIVIILIVSAFFSFCAYRFCIVTPFFNAVAFPFSVVLGAIGGVVFYDWLFGDR